LCGWKQDNERVRGSEISDVLDYLY